MVHTQLRKYRIYIVFLALGIGLITAYNSTLTMFGKYTNYVLAGIIAVAAYTYYKFHYLIIFSANAKRVSETKNVDTSRHGKSDHQISKEDIARSSAFKTFKEGIMEVEQK